MAARERCVLHSIKDERLIDMLVEVTEERSAKVFDDKEIPAAKRVEWYNAAETMRALKAKLVTEDADGRGAESGTGSESGAESASAKRKREKAEKTAAAGTSSE